MLVGVVIGTSIFAPIANVPVFTVAVKVAVVVPVTFVVIVTGLVAKFMFTEPLFLIVTLTG
jgi:hypothetical protein